MITEKILNNLICIQCSGRVDLKRNKLVCTDCRKEYSIINNRLEMLDRSAGSFYRPPSDFVVSRLKNFFKKYPKIFNIFYYLFGASFVGRGPRKMIQDVDKDKVIVNLGSGPKKIREDVINIDLYPFPNVDIVANVTRVPLKNNSVDIAISEFLLEHVKNPQAVVNEIIRILKPGGLVYVAVPFVASFHSSPDDYYRWSEEGLRELMRSFKEIEIGVRCGPTSAMLSIVNNWLATLLSFGLRSLHQFWLIIFMIITSPLKVFDYLISKFPGASNIAFGFYFIGKKK